MYCDSRRQATLPGQGGTVSFTYDPFGRRIRKVYGGATSNYVYDGDNAIEELDGSGNVLARYTQGLGIDEPLAMDRSGVTSYYHADGLGSITSLTNGSGALAASYVYDSFGKLTASTGTTNYTWDYENRLTQVTLPGQGGTVMFKYDPFGRRIYKSSSAGTYIFAYDLGNLIEETNSSGGVVARYTQADNLDEPLAMLGSGATSYYEADGLGTTTSLSNTAGALAQTYTFDSFGNQTASSGSLTNPLQYTAREFDSETNLYYYRARYYDPQPGRFLSEDPLGPKKEGPNLYEYVSNNPIMSVDPLGRFKIDKTYTDHPCVPIGGGGPNNPTQAPHQANVQRLLQQAGDEACSNLNAITDPKLRSCIQKRCKSGTIKCSDNCAPGRLGQAPYHGSTATMCLNGWPDWTQPSDVGPRIIHEWAHTCGWRHGQGGVPYDPGPARP